MVIDAIVAILVGANILFTSIDLFKQSFHGLMDSSVEKDKEEIIKKIIGEFLNTYDNNLNYGFKTRSAGQIVFVYINISVPNLWDIKKSHDLTKDISEQLQKEYFLYLLNSCFLMI